MFHPKVEFSGKIAFPKGGDFAMKKTKYTEEQIAFALKQAETGTPVQEVIRKMGNFRADLLQLEEEVRRVGIIRTSSVETT